MMHIWQALLLLISVPVLILSILSLLGQLIRLLPYVFLSVFSFSGIALILDSSMQGAFLGAIELIVGSSLTIFSIFNLYLIISSHKHDKAILQDRRPLAPIKNIVLDTLEKPKFGNPKAKQKTLNKKATTTKSKQLTSSLPRLSKSSKRSPQS